MQTMKEQIQKLKQGSIIETITNSNGTAIKFTDGTMICTKVKSFQGVAAKALGNIYATDDLDMRKFRAKLCINSSFDGNKNKQLDRIYI